MTRRPSTAFDRYVSARLTDPEFAAQYTSAREEIDAIDAVVRALDAARVSQGLSKAELAKRVAMKPEVIRRIFTADAPNPTLTTVVKLAAALDFTLTLQPRTAPPSKVARGARKTTTSRRTSARA
jgi:DNA-binding phage protein